MDKFLWNIIKRKIFFSDWKVTFIHWHMNDMNFYRVRSGTSPDRKELKNSNQQYFKLKKYKETGEKQLDTGSFHTDNKFWRNTVLNIFS